MPFAFHRRSRRYSVSSRGSQILAASAVVAPPSVLPPPPSGSGTVPSIAQPFDPPPPRPSDTPPPANIPVPAAGWGGQNNPNNPYAGSNYHFGGSPTMADKAIINGVEVWAGGPYSGKPVASSPANAGDLTPYLQNPTLAAPAGSSGPAPASVQVQQQPALSTQAQLSAISQIPGVELSEWAKQQMATPITLTPVKP
jgi:hypothetical protein